VTSSIDTSDEHPDDPAMKRTGSKVLPWIVAALVVLAVIVVIFAWTGLWPPRTVDLHPV
jgi:hypothetical protein